MKLVLGGKGGYGSAWTTRLTSGRAGADSWRACVGGAVQKWEQAESPALETLAESLQDVGLDGQSTEGWVAMAVAQSFLWSLVCSLSFLTRA